MLWNKQVFRLDSLTGSFCSNFHYSLKVELVLSEFNNISVIYGGQFYWLRKPLTNSIA